MKKRLSGFSRSRQYRHLAALHQGLCYLPKNFPKCTLAFHSSFFHSSRVCVANQKMRAHVLNKYVQSATELCTLSGKFLDFHMPRVVSRLLTKKKKHYYTLHIHSSAIAPCLESQKLRDIVSAKFLTASIYLGDFNRWLLNFFCYIYICLYVFRDRVTIKFVRAPKDAICK